MFDHLDRLQVDDKPVEIAMRIFENFRRAGQDVKIHQTSVFWHLVMDVQTDIPSLITNTRQ